MSTDTLQQELPSRPRRRLVSPATVGLAAVVIAAAGFIGGVLVQKAQGGAAQPAASAAAGAFPGAGARAGGQGQGGTASFPGGAQGGAQDGAVQPTVGSVKSKAGSVLYVETTDGTTIKIRTNDNSDISRTAPSSARGIHPGDTVIVQGKKGSNGAVTASSVTATDGDIQGGAGGFPGGGFPSSAAGGQQP